MIKLGGKYQKTKRVVKRTNRRIPRSIRDSGVSMRVEFDTVILFSNGDYIPVFGSSGTVSVNFLTILLGNPAFVSQATNFMRYKVTGSSAIVTPCFTEDSVDTAFTQGIPNIYLQQYPILTSAGIGDEVLYSDNNLLIKPLSLSQSKYWPYKSNFMIGTGNGVGTWNQTNSAATQQGQFSIGSPHVYGSAAAGCVLYSVRLCLYVTFDSKSR